MNRLYKYFGFKLGRLNERLVLHSATFNSDDSHIAVWAGVNAYDNSQWVQAGIEQMGWEKTPMAYIEIGHSGYQRQFSSWPIEYGVPVKVHLYNQGSTWQVEIEWAHGKHKHKSPKIFIARRHSVDSLLETYKGAHGVATIGFRKVKG